MTEVVHDILWPQVSTHVGFPYERTLDMSVEVLPPAASVLKQCGQV